MTRYLRKLERLPDEAQWPQLRTWMIEEPLPLYRELRARRPILVLPELALATRFADCTEILRSHDRFSVAPYKAKQGAYWMAQDDTADHWRDKSVMRAILDREDIPAIRQYVADKAAALLAGAGGTIDAVDGLTRAVPIALVQDWFGFADSDPAELQRWSYWNQLDAFWNQPFDAVADPARIVAEREAANEAMRPYLIALVQKRGAELKAGGKGNDPVSRLLRLSFSSGLRFPVERVVLNVGGLLIGAVETTSHAAVNALDFLLQCPKRAAAARAAAAADDPAELDGHVFEALRFKPAFPYFFRTVEQATTLSRDDRQRTRLTEGQTVLAVTQSAMFDPAACDEPEDFDPTRGSSNCFHFGLGLHECLGRAIGAVMIPEIVRQGLRLRDLETGAVDRKGGPVPESWSWTYGCG